MKPFALLAERTARWTSPIRWKRRFELTSADDVFATMQFEKASGSLVLARTSHDVWTLTTEGLCGAYVVVRDAISGHEVALFRGDWRGGGSVERSGGHSLVWSGANAWMTRWVFRSSSGAPLAEFRVDSMRLVPSALLRFEPGVAQSSEAPLLAILGWHLAVQASDQASLLTAASTMNA